MVFNSRIRFILLFLAFSLILALPTHAQTSLDFDDLSDSTPVTTQYSAEGVTFSNTTAITAGLSLNEFEFPPVSGANVVFDDSGPITGVFAVPVHSLSGYFTYTSPLTFDAFDSSGNLLTSVFSQYSDNTVSSGNAPNEFLQLSSPSVISSFTITGDPAGSSFTLDNFSFSPASPNPVPEANSAFGFGLLLLALGGYYLRSTRFLQTTTRLQSQTGLLKLMPVVAGVFLALLMALPAQAVQSVSTPTADADYVFVNEAKTVTLTAQVSPDPQLIASSVNSVRVSSTGAVLGVLPMYDDGTHGDKTAGDGTYAAQVNLNETAPGTATFYVTAAYRKSLLWAKSQPLNIRAVVDLNQAQVAEYVNSLSLAGIKYSSLLQAEPASPARLNLVKYLLTLPDVSSAGITPDGTTVYFMMFGNLEEDVETDLFDSNGGSLTPSMFAKPNQLTSPIFKPQTPFELAPFDAPSYSPLVGNRSVLCIGAYYDQFSVEGGDETAPISVYLLGNGLQVTSKYNCDATVNLFKTMPSYGVVVITSHGYMDAFGNVNIDTRETEIGDEHADDRCAGRIVPVAVNDSPHGYGHWAITPSFVRHYGGFQNSLIYVGSCFSLINGTMADAFIASGAKAFFGYTDEVSVLFSYLEGTTIFDILGDSSLMPASRTTQVAYSGADFYNHIDPYYVADPTHIHSPPYSTGPAMFNLSFQSSRSLALDLNQGAATPSIAGTWSGKYDFPAISGDSVTCPAGSGTVTFTFQSDNSVTGDNISGTIALDGASPYSGPSFHGTQTGATFSVVLDNNPNRIITGTINGTFLTASSTIDCVDGSGNILATGPISFSATLQSATKNVVQGQTKNNNAPGSRGAVPCVRCNASGHHRQF